MANTYFSVQITVGAEKVVELVTSMAEARKIAHKMAKGSMASYTIETLKGWDWVVEEKG